LRASGFLGAVFEVVPGPAGDIPPFSWEKSLRRNLAIRALRASGFLGAVFEVVPGPADDIPPYSCGKVVASKSRHQGL
jgi:hypothetical protein